MNIRKAFSLLMPSIFKKDLLEGLYNTKKEAQEINIPLLKEVNESYKLVKFSSKQMEAINKVFNSYVDRRYGNIVTCMLLANERILEMCDEVNPYLEKTFEETNISSVMTYKKMQYLQFIDAMKFYLEYSRNLVDYILIAETYKYDQGNQLKNKLTPFQIKQVENGITNFCHLTRVFLMKVSDVMALLSQVPDITIIEEQIEMTESTMGEEKIDPLRFGFIDARRNPFYALQQKLAIRDHMKYQKALEERDMLRLRLKFLREKQQGEGEDLATLKEIERLESEVQKLEYKIQKEEEKYA